MNGIANRERSAGLLLKKSRSPTQKQLKLRRVDRSVHCNCHWSAYQHQILHDNTLASKFAPLLVSLRGISYELSI